MKRLYIFRNYSVFLMNDYKLMNFHDSGQRIRKGLLLIHLDTLRRSNPATIFSINYQTRFIRRIKGTPTKR